MEHVDAASGALHLLIKLQCVLTDLRPLDENEDILLFDLINVGFVPPTVIHFYRFVLFPSTANKTSADFAVQSLEHFSLMHPYFTKTKYICKGKGKNEVPLIFLWAPGDNNLWKIILS